MRRDPRRPVNQDLARIDPFLCDYVADLSRSGALIRSKDPLPPGTRVTLRFTIFDDEVETVEGTGDVVRISQDPPGMAVAFAKLTPASERAIARLVSGVASRGL